MAAGQRDLAARALARRPARARPITPARPGWAIAHDPMLGYARWCWRPARPPSARRVATCGKVLVEPERGERDRLAGHRPGSTRAAADSGPRAAVVAELAELAAARRQLVTESWTGRDRVRRRCCASGCAAVLRRRAGAGHRGRPRRRHPGRRRGPDRDDVRPQPDRRLAFAGRVRRARRLPGRRRRADRRCWPSWRAGERLLRRVRLAARRAGRRTCGSTVADGRIAAVDAPEPTPGPAITGCPASCCPASPTRTATPSTGPCAAGRTTAAARSGPGASGCTRVAARLDPDTLPGAGPGDLRRDGAGRGHRGRRVPLPAPRAGRHALRRPERDGPRADRRRPPTAGIRITLLDTCYLAGGLGADGDCRWTGEQRRFGDGSASAGPSGSPRWAAPIDAVRIGAAIHSVRAVPRDQLAEVRAPADGRPLHVHLSEQPAENEQCLRLRLHARPGCWPTPACCGPARPRCTPPISTDADIATWARAAPSISFCPTTERDLADGIGPARALAAAGAPIMLGSDQNASHRPVRGGARRGDATSGWPRGSAGGSARPSWSRALTVAGQRSLGWADAGRIEVGARADLVAVRLDHPAHGRGRPGAGGVRGDGGRRRHA